MWTTSQRAVILALAIGSFAFLTFRRIAHTHFVPDPQPAEGLRAAELADRLDPNTATVAEIAAIPNVGEKLAESVVAYRDGRVKDYPGRPAFREPTDLLRVRGIGVARMEAMQAYLVFPPTTRPTAR